MSAAPLFLFLLFFSFSHFSCVWISREWSGFCFTFLVRFLFVVWAVSCRVPSTLLRTVSPVEHRVIKKTMHVMTLFFYQTSLIQCQKTYHKCQVEICFWCIVDISLHRWTNFCVRFLNFLHLLFSHHYYIFWAIRPVQQCVIKVNENPEELIL